MVAEMRITEWDSKVYLFFKGPYMIEKIEGQNGHCFFNVGQIEVANVSKLKRHKDVPG